MRLENKVLYLRPITRDDIDQLYEWRNSLGFRLNCSSRQAQVAKEAFIKELQTDFRRDRHKQFMIVRRRGDVQVGTIYSYNLNLTDGYVFITTFLDEKYRRVGYGAFAFALFCEHLFMECGLYKVYCDVYSYNNYSIKTMLNGGFVEEGRFREQKFLDGHRYDVIRLALFKSRYISINDGRKK